MYGGRPQPKTPEEPIPAALPQGSPKAAAIKVSPSVVNDVKVVTGKCCVKFYAALKV